MSFAVLRGFLEVNEKDLRGKQSRFFCIVYSHIGNKLGKYCWENIVFQCFPVFPPLEITNNAEPKFAPKKVKMFLNKFKNILVQATVCFHMFCTQPVVDSSSGFY